jgi:hypothetical protein
VFNKIQDVLTNYQFEKIFEPNINHNFIVYKNETKKVDLTLTWYNDINDLINWDNYYDLRTNINYYDEKVKILNINKKIKVNTNKSNTNLFPRMVGEIFKGFKLEDQDSINHYSEIIITAITGKTHQRFFINNNKESNVKNFDIDGFLEVANLDKKLIHLTKQDAKYCLGHVKMIFQTVIEYVETNKLSIKQEVQDILLNKIAVGIKQRIGN